MVNEDRFDKLLHDNPDYTLLSKSRLTRVARDAGISKNEIHAYFQRGSVKQQNEQFKPHRKQYFLKITAPPYTYQIDVVILPKKYAKKKKHPKFLFLVDIISRKAFAYPLKSNKVTDVLSKYEDFVQEVGQPVHQIQGDDFFSSKTFIEFNDKMFVPVITDIAKSDHITGNSNKLGIVDRAVRTIKKIMTKIYEMDPSSFKWKSALRRAITLYNNTEHSGLAGATPNEMFDDYDFSYAKYKADQKYNRDIFNKVLRNINVGTKVRILKDRKKFQKEGAVYSKHVYTVASIVGYRFVLHNDRGEELVRKYKPDELLVV
jgi:hypothetical protein